MYPAYNIIHLHRSAYIQLKVCLCFKLSFILELEAYLILKNKQIMYNNNNNKQQLTTNTRSITQPALPALAASLDQSRSRAALEKMSLGRTVLPGGV